MEKLWYLASPYSHADKWVREIRFQAISRVAGKLRVEKGIATFCPIAHSHPIAEWGGVPNTFDFWSSWDKPFEVACTGLIVAQLPGWAKSKGVNGEIASFTKAQKPVDNLIVSHWFTKAEWSMLEAGVV